MAGAIVLAGWVAATLASEIQLEAEGAGDCPPRDVLAARLAARVPGGARGEGPPAEAWRLRYRSGPPEGRSARRAISIELVDAAGQARVRRTLSVERGECRETAAAAITAIVERFFRGIGWTGGAPLPSPVAGPAVPPPPSPPPAPATTSAPTPPAPPGGPPPPGAASAAPPATAPTPPPRAAPPAAATTAGTAQAAATPARRAAAAAVTVAAGPTVWWTDRALLRAALTVRGELAAIPLALGVAALLPGAPSTQRPQGAAVASQTAWPLRLTASALLRRPAWELDAGLDLVATVDSASSTGITEPAAHTRLSLAAGLGVGAALRLGGGGWQLHAGLAGHRHVAGNRFFIQTDGGQRLFVLDRPRWQGLAMLALAYRFWL
jgi:hypothetical protein